MGASSESELVVELVVGRFDSAIVCLVTLNITNQDVARQAEQHFIQLFQREGAELLNTNRAIDPNVRRRNYEPNQ